MNPIRFLAGVFVVTSNLLFVLAGNAETSKKVKVFILAGQSNMEGHGVVYIDPNKNAGKGSFEYLCRNKPSYKKFVESMTDTSIKWKDRKDVFISFFERQGPLAVGYGFGSEMNRIGPELGFGWYLGTFLSCLTFLKYLMCNFNRKCL